VAGFDILAIGRPMRNARLWEEVRAARGRFGTDVVEREQAAPAMLRALRKNRCVAALNDQYPGRDGIFVPFLGLRASTNPGVGMLAVRTGASIVPAYIQRDGPDHHTMTFLPALTYELTGDRKQDIEIITAACNKALGDVVLLAPEHYLWGHRRFRHSPDLVDDPYMKRVSRG
jgi:KDO2-lipid IV(A) lauroyltransferase